MVLLGGSSFHPGLLGRGGEAGLDQLYPGSPRTGGVPAPGWGGSGSASPFPTGGPRVPGACLSQPCQNAGSCLEMEQGYICECQEGYSGQDCRDSEYREGVSPVGCRISRGALVLPRGRSSSPREPIQSSWTE